MVDTLKELTKDDVLEAQQSNDGNYHPQDYIDQPPDGGYGWVCCVAVSTMNFATWGANSSFGVLLSYYLETNTFKASPTAYALMMGLIMFFTLATISLSSIMLYSFGYRLTVGIGIITQLAAYIGASYATTIVQLIFTQGVLLGLSIGIIFGANSIILPTWFLKKRALATGISQAGIGIGGITFSLASNAIIQRTGKHQWVLRMLAIVSFVICTSMMFIVRIRHSSNDAFKNSSLKDVVKSVYNPSTLNSLPLQLITLWGSTTTMGYVISLFSLSNYAISIGLTPFQGTIITVVFNLSQAIGRPLTGYLCEVFGRINFSIIATFYTCIVVFVWWINVHSYGSLIAFALFLGLFVGIGSVSWTPLVVDVVGINNFASASSWVTLWMALGSLISEIIALNLRDYSLGNAYFHCQLFVGVLYFASTFVLLPYREWRIRRMVKQMKESNSITDDERQKYQKLSDDMSIRGYTHRTFLSVKI